VQNFAAQPKSYFRNFYRTSTCWYAKLYRAQSWYGIAYVLFRMFVCPSHCVSKRQKMLLRLFQRPVRVYPNPTKIQTWSPQGL